MKRTFHLTLCVLLCLLVAFGLNPAQAADKVRILVHPAVKDSLSDLTEKYPNLQLIASVEQVDRCDASIFLINEEIIRRGKNLKWVQSGSAGVEGYLGIAALKNSDITVTNAKIIQGPNIADHAMALLLSLTRDLKHFNAQMAKGSWDKAQSLPNIELHGKVMLVIGLGGIGVQVAERAFAFGMTVIAVDPKDIPMSRAIRYAGKPDELPRVLPRADVIVSCAPRTAETEGMLGKKEFALMKDGVYIINVSRGALIDTEALTTALQSGKVAAAGMDVTHPEPLPPDHPLWKMKNVTITPHVAGRSDGVTDRKLILAKDNIERFLTGKPLRNVVDKAKGY